MKRFFFVGVMLGCLNSAQVNAQVFCAWYAPPVVVCAPVVYAPTVCAPVCAELQPEWKIYSYGGEQTFRAVGKDGEEFLICGTKAFLKSGRTPVFSWVEPMIGLERVAIPFQEGEGRQYLYGVQLPDTKVIPGFESKEKLEEIRNPSGQVLQKFGARDKDGNVWRVRWIKYGENINPVFLTRAVVQQQPTPQPDPISDPAPTSSEQPTLTIPPAK